MRLEFKVSSESYNRFVDPTRFKVYSHEFHPSNTSLHICARNHSATNASQCTTRAFETSGTLMDGVTCRNDSSASNVDHRIKMSRGLPS